LSRKVALVGSLLLTTALGFFIFSTGSRAGLFGSDSPEGASANAPPSELTPLPTATPQVIETYIYQDDYAEVQAPDNSSGPVGFDAGWVDDGASVRTPAGDDEHESSEHEEGEHEEEEDEG